MKDVYELVDIQRGEDGELIDVYEHSETGKRIRYVVDGSKEEWHE